MANELIKLLEAFPDENWNHYELFRNPNLTVEYIIQHPRREYMIECNKKASIKDMLKYPDVGWYWHHLEDRRDFRIDFLFEGSKSWLIVRDIDEVFHPKPNQEYIKSNDQTWWEWTEISEQKYDTIDQMLIYELPDPTRYLLMNAPLEVILSKGMTIDYDKLSFNHSVSESYIREHINLDWYFDEVVSHSNISENFVLEHLDKLKFRDRLEYNPNLSEEFIIEHRLQIIDDKRLLNNPNISIEFLIRKIHDNRLLTQRATKQDILNNPGYQWEWLNVFKSGKLEWEDIHLIKDSLDIISWQELSSIAPLDFVIANQALSWDWNEISHHALLDDIIDNPDLPWNLSANKNLTIDFIEANIDIPWNYSKLASCAPLEYIIQNWDKFTPYLTDLSKNPNLTCDFVLRHPDLPWDFNELSKNEFRK